MKFQHTTVLLRETVDGVFTDPKGVYVDLTTGGGGHSLELAKRLSGGRLVCFDRDGDAIEAAGERLKGYPVTFVKRNFKEFRKTLDELGIDTVDGIIGDLGVSSHQLDDAERGFSFHADAPLDMRMSGEGMSAFDVVNGYSFEELRRILYEFGEEKFAPKIAQGIIDSREAAPIETTGQLAEVIKKSVPAAYRREKNPCRKTFQAVRIEVNGELDALDKILSDGFDCLKVGGRMAVITFHSLEDRMVKTRFKEFCQGCVCPPEFPVCVCGRLPRGELVSKKPIVPDTDELENNPRSRSAKLRIIKKIRQQMQLNN